MSEIKVIIITDFFGEKQQNTDIMFGKRVILITLFFAKINK